MVISFFGHRDFCESDAYEKKLLDILEELVGEDVAEFYLGGYGGFDSFAYRCCTKYKKAHPHVKLIYVTPYLSQNDLKEKYERYDEILYPEIENVPPKFAILYRNRYMVERSDFVISYIRYQSGGAYQAYSYARKKGKRIVELETELFPELS